MLISQRPSRLDETIISQCNSFLILRLVNPRDQNFVRAIMENLTESDARMLPGFGPGQGIVSGQVVKFPLPVHVKMDEELLAAEIGDEDFFEEVGDWKPGAKTVAKRKLPAALRMLKLHAKNYCPPKGCNPAGKETGPQKEGLIMADVLTSEQRQRNMRNIHGKNTKPELLLRRALHKCGLRYRLYRRDLPGCPDLVFPKYRTDDFCTWMLLASTWMRSHQHSDNKTRILGKEIRG